MRLVGVKVDITERKTAEQRLQEQQRNLAHSARVSVAGELSSALSHELNQPLAAILANAAAARRFLLHDPPDMQEISDILEAIAEDNRRAAAVVARFGSLLKRDLASMKPVDINDVVAGALDLAHGDVIARGVSLTKRFGRNLPPVSADAGQLQEVLLNLVSNACEAMEPMPAGTRRLAVTTARRRPRRGARDRGRQRPGRAARDDRRNLRAVRHVEAAAPGHGPGDLPLDRFRPRRRADGGQTGRSRRRVFLHAARRRRCRCPRPSRAHGRESLIPGRSVGRKDAP